MNKVDDLICEKCGSSWPSKERHLKAHKKRKLEINEHDPIYDDLQDEFETEDEEISTSEFEQDNSETMPVFQKTRNTSQAGTKKFMNPTI